MDTSWLEYCATDEQLKAFNDTGYLVVEDAISTEMVDALEEVADRVDAEERAKTGLAPHKLLSKFRTVAEDDLLLELLDNKKVFPLLWDILGWNIQLYISHLIMYPPEPPDKQRVAQRRTLASGRGQTRAGDGTSTPATLIEGQLLAQ